MYTCIVNLCDRIRLICNIFASELQIIVLHVDKTALKITINQIPTTHVSHNGCKISDVHTSALHSGASYQITTNPYFTVV